MPPSPPPLSASAIKIIQRIVSAAEAEPDEDFAIVVGSGEDGRGGGGCGAHDERPLLSVFGDHAEVVVGEASERARKASLSTIDGAAFVRIFIAVAVPHMHSAFGGRRRSLSAAAMPFITDLLSQLSVSRGSKGGGGGLAAINQIGNGQTL